ncbi:MAG: hypothetical protein ACLR8Y_09615 [Alistipes indistinctus]
MPVSQFRLIDESAVEELKNIENNPAIHFDHSVPIEGVIAAVARCIPDVAVVTDKASFTYADIDRISTVMAKNLAALGVSRGNESRRDDSAFGVDAAHPSCHNEGRCRIYAA